MRYIFTDFTSFVKKEDLFTILSTVLIPSKHKKTNYFLQYSTLTNLLIFNSLPANLYFLPFTFRSNTPKNRIFTNLAKIAKKFSKNQYLRNCQYLIFTQI